MLISSLFWAHCFLRSTFHLSTCRITGPMLDAVMSSGLWSLEQEIHEQGQAVLQRPQVTQTKKQKHLDIKVSESQTLYILKAISTFWHFDRAVLLRYIKAWYHSKVWVSGMRMIWMQVKWYTLINIFRYFTEDCKNLQVPKSIFVFWLQLYQQGWVRWQTVWGTTALQQHKLQPLK